ncbi:MAG TPA: hypothetical protein VFB13_03760 [Reyranella sp.]|nr:hypothetical protein [Reyranella sp.]
MTNVICKDGQSTVTADIPLASHKFTGVSNATARDQFPSVGQIQDSTSTYIADSGAADAYVITLAPAITSYAVGQMFAFLVAHANATTTPTLAANGLTAGTIKYADNTALRASDMPANAIVEVRVAAVSSGTPTFHLVSVSGKPALVAAANTYIGANDFTGGSALVPTQAVGDSSTKAASTAFTGTAITNAVGGAALRSYLAGLALSNDGTTPNTKLDVAAGICTDDTNAYMLSLLSGVIDCTTVGANGLDAGSLAASTWYHVYAISKAAGASPALLASTNASSPTLPATYTLKRRIGSFKTDGSAHILAFVQWGDNFRWVTPVLDASAVSLTTTFVDLTLTVPTGVQVQAYGSAQSSSGTQKIMLRPKAASAGSTPPLNSIGGSNSDVVGYWTLVTDTAAKIQWAANSSSSSNYLQTEGWYDRRGKDN